ncbi:MAG: SDR family NAD(P)-dependent oxidoreductase [Rhizobacter sp.]|nr:SDR family NAD(P)-dependent oxidoreductase [Rhizobacter sp.]
MSETNKLCVVAGAGPGLGLAIARRFAAEGHDIALIARNGSALETAAAALRQGGVRASGFACDLTNAGDIARTFDEIRVALGDATVMVYNAARWNQVPAMSIAPDEFAADLALAITGGLACAQQVYPRMRAAGCGSLLFTGGGLALAPQYGAGVTSLVAGKAGVRGFVYALHAELAGQGIRVGTVTVAGIVAPGTPFDPDQIAQRFWELHSQSDGPVEIIHDGKP